MTAHPYGTLAPEQYRELLRANALALVAAARSASLGARVPSCPEWDLRALLVHVGQVHEWVRAVVIHGDADPGDRITPGPDVDVPTWYLEQAERLLDVLDTTPPDQPCTGHQPDNQRAGYWSRRQAHEVVMHRIDAELASGSSVSYEPALTCDGIGEVLDVWMPVICKRIEPPDLVAPVLLTCTDRPDRWLLTPAAGCPDSEGPVVTTSSERHAAIAGTAHDLLCALWKRPATVTVDGEAAQRLLDSRLTP